MRSTTTSTTAQDGARAPEGDAVDVKVEALARQLQSTGDGLGPWYSAVHPGVLRLCRGFLASRAGADDAAQDVMLQLHDSLRSWDSTRPFAAWSRVVVLNHCRNRSRTEARRRAHEEQAGAPWALREAPSPEAAAESGELAQMIDSALSVLPPREREVFVLIDLEGVSTAEVAAALEVTASTVRASLAMARRRLRTALNPEGGTP